MIRIYFDISEGEFEKAKDSFKTLEDHFGVKWKAGHIDNPYKAYLLSYSGLVHLYQDESTAQEAYGLALGQKDRQDERDPRTFDDFLLHLKTALNLA